MLKRIKLTISIPFSQWQLLRRMVEDRTQADEEEGRVSVNGLIIEAVKEFLEAHGYRKLAVGETAVKYEKKGE